MGLLHKELKAVWVLENARKNRNFYMPEIELLYMVASVIQWKKFNPNIPTYLICTYEVHQKFCELDLTYLWDHVDIDILNEGDSIDRGPFWACSKIKAMRKISAPFVMMDNDLYLTRGNVMTEEDFSEFGVVVSHRESGPGYYLLSTHHSLAGLEGLYQPDLRGDSFNVSFLYIRDDDFRKRYCEKAYEWMTALSDGRPGVHGGHMIFCEQKLLYDMVVSEGVSHKAVISDVLDCNTAQFKTSSPSQLVLDHLGPKKRNINQDLLVRKKSDVLLAIKDYHNIKHIFLCLKKNDSEKIEHSGKFFLSCRLSPSIEESVLKHQNRADNKTCVVYSIWEEHRYISYLKYSLMSLISSTDVRARADIIIFISENLFWAIKCLEGLVSAESFVVVKDVKALKYTLPTHPRLQKYSHVMMVDADAFFVGRSLVFQEIENFYSDPKRRRALFMMSDKLEASSVFWTRKKDLCKSLDEEAYEMLFRKRIGDENYEQMMSQKWWISCVMIFTQEHFREESFFSFMIEQMWFNQMCDETVFISWAAKRGYQIEDTERFFKCFDRYTPRPDQLVLYHPIVGENTTSPSNEELISEIEKRYENLIKTRGNNQIQQAAW